MVSFAASLLINHDAISVLVRLGRARDRAAGMSFRVNACQPEKLPSIRGFRFEPYRGADVESDQGADIVLPAHHVHRHVVEHRPVDEETVPFDDRREKAGDRHACAHVFPQQALIVDPLPGGVQIGAHTKETDPKILDLL